MDGNPCTQFLDVRNDANQPTALTLHIEKRANGNVKRLTVQRSKAFVDENHIEMHSARIMLHDIRQSKCQ